MEIEHLEAGEELDWLVLHHVFDWTRGIPAFGEAPYRRGSQEFPALWPVSTDVAYAWRVIDHAARLRLTVTIEFLSDAPKPGWRVGLSRSAEETVYGFGETAPLAICKVALRAVEGAFLVKSSRTLAPESSPDSETLN